MAAEVPALARMFRLEAVTVPVLPVLLPPEPPPEGVSVVPEPLPE